jgi:hypothetical protein
MIDRLYLGVRLDSATNAVRNRLFVGKRGIWITGVIVALLTWQVSIAIPAAGLDESWKAGIYMATQHGMDFGSELVFTYGPLGFLSYPGLWVGSLGILAFLFTSAIFIAFSVALVAALERSTNLVVAAIVSFLFFTTLPALDQAPLMLALGFCFFALRADPPDWGIGLLAIGGGALSAIECMIKLSVGPEIFIVCLLAMVGARAGKKHWAMFLAGSIGGFILLWLIAGQPLGSLGDYITNSAQIVSGYNEAMSIGGAPKWGAAALIVGAVCLIGMTALAPFKDERARWFAVAVVAIAALATYKYGIVRFEIGHLAIALSALLGFWLQLPWPKVRATPFLTATAVIGIVFTHAYPWAARPDVIGNLKAFRANTELVVRSGERKQKTEEARAALQASYNIDPSILDAVRGRTVSIEPWEATIAWAYELDWDPAPVFQNYVAYTSKLDKLNADALRDPKGPETILRPAPGYSVWEAPEQAVAAFCNFASGQLVSPWHLLERIPNRCEASKLISSVKANPGQDISIPQAGRNQLVILKVEGAAIKGLERLTSLVWKPPIRTVGIDGGPSVGRLAPATIGDGMIVSVDPSLDGSPGAELLPHLDQIRIDGVSRQLDYKFYRVAVHTRPEPDGQPQANG